MRTIERSVRRSAIPVVFSQGYHPRPRISYGPPLPLGMTSTGEYLDMELKERWDPNELKDQMNRHLPGGLRFLAAGEVEPDSSLMTSVTAARYAVLGFAGKVSELRSLVEEFMGAVEIPIIRHRKKGDRQINLRPLILDLRVVAGEGCARLGMILRTGSHGNARVDEVLEVLGLDAGCLHTHRYELYCGSLSDLHTPLSVENSGEEVIDLSLEGFDLNDKGNNCECWSWPDPCGNTRRTSSGRTIR